MTKTILDYIIEKKVEKPDKKLIAEYIELVHRLALRSSETLIKLYELVDKSSDKELRKKAHRLFSKTVIDIAAALNKLNKIEKQLSKQ